MPQTIYRSRRAELVALRAELAGFGAPVDRIAAVVRTRLRVNSRIAFRQAHGLTQQEVADRWNRLWPSEKPLTHKQISYWEAWPAASGRPPSIEDLNRLARIYQCSAIDLLDGMDLAAGTDGAGATKPAVPAPTSAMTVYGPEPVQPYDVVRRVHEFVTSPEVRLADDEGRYRRLVQELIGWAEHMQRRDILQWLSSAAAVAAAAPVLHGLDQDERERTAAAVTNPSRVDNQTIEHIEAVLWRCERQDDTLGPAAALETTLAQRNLVRTLLPATSGAVRQRLLSLYAQILRFAGWLSFDLNDYESAGAYLEQARTAAHEAQNTELGALVLCTMSHLATWRGQPRTGIDHALAASGWAMRTDDDRLKAYAFDVAARAYAMDRQETAALGAVDSARKMLNKPAVRPDSLAYFCDTALLTSDEGSCRLWLGQAEHAAAIAEQALDAMDPTFVRNIAFTSLDLGLCHMRAAKPDITQAAEAIGAAVRLANQNRSVRLVQQLRGATKELTRWASLPEVRDVSELMIVYGLAA